MTAIWLAAAILSATIAAPSIATWGIRVADPAPPREYDRRNGIAAESLELSSQFVGCYRLELPDPLRVRGSSTLDVYLSRSPGETAASFASFFDPESPLQATWGSRDGETVAFGWSTGLGGLSVTMKKSSSGFDATGTNFSDNLGLQPPPSYPVKVKRIRCTTTLRESEASRIRERKVAIWAMHSNLESRRRQRERYGAAPVSPLMKSQRDLLNGATLLSPAEIELIAAEVESSDWPERSVCSPGHRRPYRSVPLQLELPPEVRIGTPSGEGCVSEHRYFDVTVDPTGRVREARISGTERSLNREAISREGLLEVDRALHQSRWYPALWCGRPTERTIFVELTRRTPCSTK
jgi:hypothetical protein